MRNILFLLRLHPAILTAMHCGLGRTAVLDALASLEGAGVLLVRRAVGGPNQYDLSQLIQALEPVREPDQSASQTSPPGGPHQSARRTGPVRRADPKEPKKEPNKKPTAVRAPARPENRKRLQRELAEHLREKDSAALALLRAKITAARVERRHRLHAARQSCRNARLALRERQREQRHLLTLEHRTEREQGRATCDAGKQQAREEGVSLEGKARSEYAEERSFQRQMRRATKPRVERSTVRERRQEDDDAVRANLPPELVPVLDQHRRAIKGSARRSRTEAFLVLLPPALCGGTRRYSSWGRSLSSDRAHNGYNDASQSSSGSAGVTKR